MEIKKAFTIIELVIVLGVILITLPAIFGLFFINLRSQKKINTIHEVKKNGDFALDVIQNIIKSRANRIYSDQSATVPVCQSKTSGTASLSSFKDVDGSTFYFSLSAGQIASFSGVISPNPYLLTNSKVAVSNFTLTCDRTNTFSPPLVSISFKVDQATGSLYEDVDTMTFQTKVKLRNY